MKEERFKSASASYREEAAYRCPCCLYVTLHGRGQFEICPVCNWEDDGQDGHDASDVRGGPNGLLSLLDARANFQTHGVSDPKLIALVRPPSGDEQSNRRSGLEPSVCLD